MVSTNADPAPTDWAIDDPVIRLRVLGSEHVYDLATSDRWILGSSRKCSLRIDDPAGQVSRRHAIASREGKVWTMTDLDSTNGLRVNREVRRAFEIVPGDEIELGRIILIAESRRSTELRALVRRWLGWSMSRLVEVDRALREVRELAHGRAMLILRGAGSLASVARRLHRLTLGDRPFIVLGSHEPVAPALERAAEGMLFIEARHLPRDLASLAPDVQGPMARVRLVVSAERVEESARLAAMMPRVATVSIPPLSERPDEIERLLDAYGQDAMAALGAPALKFRPGDREWLRSSSSSSWIATLDAIEDAAHRLIALRNWGVLHGAQRLGINHGALSRWARRRGIPT